MTVATYEQGSHPKNTKCIRIYIVGESGASSCA